MHRYNSSVQQYLCSSGETCETRNLGGDWKWWIGEAVVQVILHSDDANLIWEDYMNRSLSELRNTIGFQSLPASGYPIQSLSPGPARMHVFWSRMVNNNFLLQGRGRKQNKSPSGAGRGQAGEIFVAFHADGFCKRVKSTVRCCFSEFRIGKKAHNWTVWVLSRWGLMKSVACVSADSSISSRCLLFTPQLRCLAW